MMYDESEILLSSVIGTVIAIFLLKTGRVLNALELCKECLILLNNRAWDSKREQIRIVYRKIWSTMLNGYYSINDHTNGMDCYRKFLDFLRVCGERAEEGEVAFNAANFYHFQLSRYKEAEELYKRALRNAVETSQRQREAMCYVLLGNVYQSLNKYGKAKECLKKALVTNKETADRQGEAVSFEILAALHQSLGEYDKAEEYQKKALVIRKETGDRKGEAACYGELGKVYRDLGEYGKAQEYQKKALVISKETGDRKGEATYYEELGVLYYSFAEYAKAEEYVKKALVIRKEIGERVGEAKCYGTLGALYGSLSKHGKAEEYGKKALVITKEIGDRKGEADCYGNLGTVYQSLGEYGKAEEYQKKALLVRKEVGDRKGEAVCYGNLGTLCGLLGLYDKAEEYQIKALVIRKENGDRRGEAACYGNLGAVYQPLGEYRRAEENLKKALVIRKEIGDRKGEATCYGNLGVLYQSLKEHGRAEEYQKKAAEIRREIGDKEGEASCYLNLGSLFCSLEKYAEAKEYHRKALAISKEIGDIQKQLKTHYHLACDELFEGKKIQQEVVSDLFSSIEKSEEMRSLLRENEQFKISLQEENIHSYRLLSALLCNSGNPNEALYVVELERARALADLMSAQYAVKLELSANPQSWFGIERIMNKEINCSCLYLSYWASNVFVWVLKANKPVLFRQIDVNGCFVSKGSKRNVHEVFSEGTVRKFGVLPQEHCEDRSLFLSNPSDSARESSQRDSMAASRPVEDEEDENQQPVPTLAECYQMIIAPVADVLNEPEIIIVPDRFLYKVPFAALKDENGKYLSETFRIRVVPSLMTLKLIQDSPPDHHSQTGALIVGEPDVSEVLYKGRKEKLCPLPCARREAEMIGRLLGVQPLLGKQATKQAVLQSIHSVSLIHFAAHGNAERGEIALTPQSPIDTIPAEEDYLLTMADISHVRLRAKLVVLSCCHTARGQINFEGVVGIARAFLGSGARSVLVALWALGDIATEELMNRFYEHLVRGESASESLHQAMKWMRSNGYPDVRDWAPFVLIGDDVTFDFKR